jgi:hypothetical protein
MGRIAGESRGDARIRRGCRQALDTLMKLMTTSEDEAIQLRAATVMVRTFASGIVAADRPAEQRITWEQYVAGVHALDQEDAAQKAGGGPSPSADGNGERAAGTPLSARRHRDLTLLQE